jgi:hypothetical protein
VERVSLVHEQHRTGLFSRGLWLRLRLLADAGFDPSSVTEDTTDERRRDVFLVGGRSPEPAPYRGRGGPFRILHRSSSEAGWVASGPTVFLKAISSTTSEC